MSNQDLKEAKNQHEVLSMNAMAGVSPHTEHPDAQWFKQAGLGMFLHWGIPSVSGEFDLSWSMRKGTADERSQIAEYHGLGGPMLHLTPEEYWEYAKYFKPSQFDPEKILHAAKEAGFRYAVLTTRHHDGFALWPSDYGNFNTKNYMGGRDLVGEYVAACRKCGMKVGLYYSPPDWYFTRNWISFGEGAFYDTRWRRVPERQPTETELHDYCAYLRGQVDELLTRYGKIDLLWFDGTAPEETPLTLDYIRSIQPGIVLNNRIGFGDYLTPEGTFPSTRPDSWWEECHVLNVGGWGYRSHEIYKPAGFLPLELAKVRSWNGNLLLNFAPDAQGRLPEVAYRRLAEIRDWMAHCSEAYFQVSGGAWPERCNRPVTQNKDRTYIHFDFLCDGKARLEGLSAPPKRIFSLRTGKTLENCLYSNGVLTIELDATRMSLMGEIAVLEN